MARGFPSPLRYMPEFGLLEEGEVDFSASLVIS